MIQEEDAIKFALKKKNWFLYKTIVATYKHNFQNNLNSL